MFHSHNVKGTFRPLQDFVILRPVPEATIKEKGGIHLPSTAHEYGRCEVMAVGPGVRTSIGVLVPCEIKVGEFVYIQKFVEGEMAFHLNGQKVYAIRERHINVMIEGFETPKRPPKKRRR